MDAVALVIALAALLAALALAARFGHRRGRSGRGLLSDNWRGAAGSSPHADELYALSSQLQAFYNATAHPADLRSSKIFRRAVALLCGPAFEGSDLVGYLAGDNAGGLPATKDKVLPGTKVPKTLKSQQSLQRN